MTPELIVTNEQIFEAIKSLESLIWIFGSAILLLNFGYRLFKLNRELKDIDNDNKHKPKGQRKSK